MECLMCGQCCRAISLDQSPDQLRELAAREREKLNRPTPHRADIQRLLRDIDFMLAHFHPMDRAEALVINPGLAELDARSFYRCDALAADGSCSRHRERPFVCEGYPWYYGTPNPALLVCRPCGYERNLGQP